MRPLIFVCFTSLFMLTGCDKPPKRSSIQWIARDAWDSGCAHAAIVEKFAIKSKGWKEKGKLYAADVTATFKLVNPCETGTNGRTYKQFATADFAAPDLVLAPCTDGGAEGWARVPDGRCITGASQPKEDYATGSVAAQPKPPGAVVEPTSGKPAPAQEVVDEAAKPADTNNNDTAGQ